jgi:hypothetical protein
LHRLVLHDDGRWARSSLLGLNELLNQMQLPEAMALRLNLAGIELWARHAGRRRGCVGSDVKVGVCVGVAVSGGVRVWVTVIVTV